MGGTGRTRASAGLAIAAAIAFVAGCGGSSGGGRRPEEPTPAPTGVPFAGTERLGVGDAPAEVVVLDLEDDGLPELLVVEASEDRVGVYARPDAQRPFELRRSIATGDLPEAIAVADFDEDGRPDLAVVEAGDATLSLFSIFTDRLVRRGTFAAGTDPRDVAVGDLDGDGFLDLVIADRRGNVVSARYGDGAFGFGELATLARVFVPNRVETGDFDLDGRDDVLVVSRDVDDVHVVFASDDGPRLGPSIPVGRAPGDADPVDLDGDGRLDLVVTSLAEDRLDAFFGLGDGTFGPGRPTPTGAGPAEVLVRDLDRDGAPDLVTLDETAITATVLRNDGAGGLDAVDSALVGASPGPGALADLDGDDVDDLVVPLRARGAVALLRGERGEQGGAEAIAFGSTPVLAVSDLVTGVAAGDLDGDGRVDLATVGGTADDVRVFVQGDGGRFEEGDGFFAGLEPFDIAAADLDGDELVDLLVTLTGEDRLAAFYGDGKGGFGKVALFDAAPGPRWLASGDFDGDRDADFAAACRAGRALSVFLVNRFGELNPPAAGRDVALGTRPSEAAVADYDADGIADVAVLAPESDTVILLVGQGGGAFRSRATGRVATARTGIWGGPLDEIDGADLVVGAGDTAAVSFGRAIDIPGTRLPSVVVDPVPAGNEPGRVAPLLFDRGPSLPLGAAPAGIVGGDFDGDGRPDLAVAVTDRDELRFFRGGAHGFEDAGAIGVALGPTRIVVADVDGDGRDDLLIASASSGAVSILYSTLPDLEPEGESGSEAGRGRAE